MNNQPNDRPPIRGQTLRCARCGEFFTFVGGRVEQVAGGKLVVRHLECGAPNELAPNGMSADGHELWKVVGVVRPLH
jgi:hypothetical protein